MEASLKHLDLHQAVELILQFFKENNLNQSFQSLASETGVEYSILSNKEEFLECVQKGQWQQVLKQLQFLKIDKKLLQKIYEQIIKELLLEKEFELAQVLIKEQTDLLSDTPDLLQDLWDLTQMREPPHTINSLFKQFKSVEESRKPLANALNDHLILETMQSNRLLTLLAKGIFYEQQLINGEVQTLSSPRKLKVQEEKENGEELDSEILFLQKIIASKLFKGDFKLQSIAISHDKRYFALGGSDGLIEIWNYKDMALDLSLPYQKQSLFMLHRKAILSLLFSNDDKILASGDSEGIIRIWKFSDGKKLREIDTQGGENSGISSMTLTSNNSQIIVGCLDGSIRVYGLKSGNLMKHFKAHDSFLQQVQLIPQREQFLVSSSEDGTICIWNLTESDAKNLKVKMIETPAQRLKKDFVLNNFQINSKNPKEMLISSRYKSAHLVNIDTNQIIQEYESNQSKDEEIIYTQFSSDFSMVYALSTSKNLYIFEKLSAKLISIYKTL